MKKANENEMFTFINITFLSHSNSWSFENYIITAALLKRWRFKRTEINQRNVLFTENVEN